RARLRAAALRSAAPEVRRHPGGLFRRPDVQLPPVDRLHPAKRTVRRRVRLRQRGERELPVGVRKMKEGNMVRAIVVLVVAVFGCGSVSTSGNDAAAGGRGGTTGTGGTGVCNVLCTTGRMCCGGTCVNLENDPFNCGTCGNTCKAPTSFCGAGTCQAPACGPAVDCLPDATCCGNTCCGAGQLCCEQQGPVSGG